MNITRIDTKEELKANHLKNDPTVIVIDTCMFSSTVISLFDAGVQEVRVFEEHYDNTDYPFGSEIHKDSEFNNHPQSVYGAQLDGHNLVGLTSDNGAKACIKVKNLNPKSEIIIGSTVNASAVARYLKNNNTQDLVILQSGRRGNFQIEDAITSGMIGEHLRGEELQYPNIYKKSIENAIKEIYSWVPQEDIDRITNFNNSNTIPISNKYNDKYLTLTDHSQ